MTRDRTVTILETEWDAILEYDSVEKRWNVIEALGQYQLDRISEEDRKQLSEEARSHLRQFEFYLERRRIKQLSGSKGGKVTQEMNRLAKAVLKQNSRTGQGNFKQYKDKTKNKNKDKSEPTDIISSKLIYSDYPSDLAEALNRFEQMRNEMGRSLDNDGRA